MKLIEIKNNFAKLYYLPADDELHIGDFLTINDGTKKIAAQIITIESTSKDDTNCAVIKFSFYLNENGTGAAYTGYVPKLDSKICKTDGKIIKSIFSKKDNSVLLGDFVSYPELDFCVDSTFGTGFTCVQSDRIENTNFIINKLAQSSGKGLIVDFDGTLEIENALVFALGKNFRLPISVEILNYIYENDLIGLTVEQKAIIQDIVLEIQAYIESEDSGYIPFNSLMSVVDDIYKEDKSVSIILFRNKLLKYAQMHLFASAEAEIEALFESVEKGELVMLNMENIPSNWQKEALSFVTGHVNGELRLFMNLDDDSVDKKLLMSLYKKQNIKPVIASAYSSKYSTTLKSLARNLILFAPEEEQKSYPTYVSFLSLLKDDDFVLTGEQTYYTPLILCPHKPKNEVSEPVQEEEVIEQPEIVEELPPALEDETDVSEIRTIFEESVEDEIAKDVDAMFYAQPKQETAQNEPESQQIEELQPIGELEPLQALDSEVEIVQPQEEMPPEPPLEHVEEPELSEVSSDEHISEDETFSESDLDVLDMLDDNEETIELDIGENDEQHEPVNNDIFEAEPLAGMEDDDSLEILDENEQENSSDELSELDSLIDSASLEEDMQEETQIEPHEDENEDEDSLIAEVNNSDDVLPPPQPDAPNIPIYTTEMDQNLRPDETIKVAEGNIVYHEKYGRGVVEQIITYGKKTLCSIQFDNVGRRLLDPNLADLKQA